MISEPTSTFDKLVARFRSHPVIQEVERQQAEEVRTTRVALANERAALLRDFHTSAEVTKLGRACDAAREEVEAAAAALEEKRAAYAKASSARSVHSDTVQRRITILEYELVELAPPEVSAFIEWALQEMDVVMGRGAGAPLGPGETRLVGDRLESLRAAIQEAQELRFRGDVDVEAELGRLRARIGAPPVDRHVATDVMPVAESGKAAASGRTRRG